MGEDISLHGIIDIGSNTIRLAIYAIRGDQVDMLMKKKHTVGLASYLQDGVMQQAGIDKAVEILGEYRSFLESFRIGNVTAFTTAALRNAKNSREAVGEIEARVGFPIQVISGDEEAELDFIGALHGLSEDSGIMADIGGGSTEIVCFHQRKIAKKVSLPMGSLMFHSRYSKDILPDEKECEVMAWEARKVLSGASEFHDVSHGRICGIGGTFKGAVALHNAMFSIGSENKRMGVDRMREIIRRFQRDLGTEDIALLMKTVPERMHTLLPGLVIAEVLATHFGSDTILYSDSGMREGYIYDRILQNTYPRGK